MARTVDVMAAVVEGTGYGLECGGGGGRFTVG